MLEHGEGPAIYTHAKQWATVHSEGVHDRLARGEGGGPEEVVVEKGGSGHFGTLVVKENASLSAARRKV